MHNGFVWLKFLLRASESLGWYNLTNQPDQIVRLKPSQIAQTYQCVRSMDSCADVNISFVAQVLISVRSFAARAAA